MASRRSAADRRYPGTGSAHGDEHPAHHRPGAPRLPEAIGRPRTKGKRLPTLAAVLADPAAAWQRITVPRWYGGGERSIEISTSTAVWRHSGMHIVPIRWAELAKILWGWVAAGP